MAAAALAALALVAAASSALPGALADSHDAPAVDPAAPQLIAAGSLGGLGDLGDIDAFAMNGDAYAVAASRTQDAVHLIRVHDNGALSLAESVYHGGEFWLDRAAGVDAFSMNGSAYVIVVSPAPVYQESYVQLIRIHANGTMEAAGHLLESEDRAGRALHGATRVAAFSMNGSMYAVATALVENGIQLIRIHANGTLEAKDTVHDGGGVPLVNPWGVSVLDLGGTPHALTGALYSRSIQLFPIYANNESLGVGPFWRPGGDALWSVSSSAIFEMNNTVHALVTVDEGNRVHLVRIHGNGTMDALDTLIDNDDLTFMRPNGAALFETVTGARYGLVTGWHDHGVQLLRIHANGTLGYRGLPGNGSATDGADGFDRLRSAYTLSALSLDGRAHAIVASRNGDGVQLIELSPVAAVRANSTAADDFYAPGSTIDIGVTFDDTVRAEGPLELRLNTGGSARYHNGSGSDTLVFRYTVGLGEDTDDLDYAGIHALTGKGNITHAATGAHAGRTLPPPGSDASLGDTKNIIVRGAPAVSEDGVYGAGEQVDIRVIFDEPVEYSGDPPSLLLNVGGETREAAYESGSGTRSLVFSYTVRAGDYEADLDYYGADALTGTIKNLAGNDVEYELPPPGSPGSLAHAHDVVVDHAAPRLIAAGHAIDGANSFNALNGAVDIDHIAVNGSAYLVVAAFGENAVQLVRVHKDGRMEAAGEARHGSAYDRLAAPHGVDAFYTNGSAYAIASSYADPGGAQLIRINGDGTLAAAGSLADNASLALDGAFGVAAFNISGTAHALVASWNEHGFELVRITEEGGLEGRGNITKNGRAEWEMLNAFGVAPFDLAGAPHALVAGYGDRGVTLIRTYENGTVSRVDSLADNESLRLSGPRDIGAFRLGGVAHALVASQLENAVQLLRVTEGGAIEPAGTAVDGVGGFDRLNGANGVAAFGGGTGGGDAYALVSSVQDRGVQIVRVSGGGGAGGAALLPAGSAADGSGDFEALNDAASAAVFDLGGRMHAAVAARGDNGVQLIRLSGAPVVNVTTALADGTYGPGSAIDIKVAFDSPVLAEEPLELRLNNGGSARYHNGSGNDTLVFRYIVAASDRDAASLEYDGVLALRAGRGGSITESGAGHHARAVLPPPGSLLSLGGSASIAVDAPPFVKRVSPPTAGGTYGIGDAILVNVTFDEPVQVEGSPRLALDMGGASRAAAYASGSGTPSLLFAYTVAEGDMSGGLSYADGAEISLPDGASIKDLTGNAANRTLPAPGSPGSLAGTPALDVDGARPAVASVSSPNASGTYGLGKVIHIRANFTEPVLVQGSPLLPLDAGNAGRAAVYASGSGAASLLFAYTVAEGDMSGGLSYADGAEISLPEGASIEDAAGNAANLTLPAPGSPGSLAGSGLIVDSTLRAAATASAAFVGPNTVRIDYTAPLGPPAGHGGPVYGEISVAGGGAAAESAGESGLGTQAHTVGFGGDGAARGQSGTIELLADLVGEAGGVQYGFDDDVIRVMSGAEARRLAPAGTSPVVAIEAGGYVREVDSTAAGAAACPSINVTSLASGADATMPGERVGVIASFAEVWFPPNATASPAPAGGLLGLCVSQQPPTAVDIAGALGEAAAGLDVLTIVEIGDNATHIRFDMPVRILLAGQANASAFYVNGTSGAVVPIAECPDGDIAAVHASLNGTGACHADSDDGIDKVIHTHHLTQFGAARPPAGTSGPGPGPGTGGPGPGTGGPGPGDGGPEAPMCSAILDKQDIKFGPVKAGAQSANMSQTIRSTDTLDIDEVSINATAWTVEAGDTVMPPGATQFMAGGAGWTPLESGAVVVQAGGPPVRSVSIDFRLAVPAGTDLPGSATSAQVSQNVTYTVTCAPPTG